MEWALNKEFLIAQQQRGLEKAVRKLASGKRIVLEAEKEIDKRLKRLTELQPE